MKTRFYVCGIGYDKNNCVTDYERDFGDFDTYEEAYELFVKLQCKDESYFFKTNNKIYQLLIQIEECKETKDDIECVDVKNEWWIVNPKFEDNILITKKAAQKFLEDFECGDILAINNLKQISTLSTQKNLILHKYLIALENLNSIMIDMEEDTLPWDEEFNDLYRNAIGLLYNKCEQISKEK